MTLSVRRRRRDFATAVHDLTEEPTSDNVVRYLVASRNLAEAEAAARKLERARGRVDRRIRLPRLAPEPAL